MERGRRASIPSPVLAYRKSVFSGSTREDGRETNDDANLLRSPAAAPTLFGETSPRAVGYDRLRPTPDDSQEGRATSRMDDEGVRNARTLILSQGRLLRLLLVAERISRLLLGELSLERCAKRLALGEQAAVAAQELAGTPGVHHSEI